MSMKWERVKFGECLRPNSRPYTLGPEEDANLVGMRLYGGGPFHRELKPAMKIAKKTHFVIREGDVIYNKLFAWKGTFGIVPPQLDGMFVSDKFPTYVLDRMRLDDRYLQWYFRYPPLWEEARTMSTGSAALSKLTLNPPKFLQLTIPLPPLTEQRRIIARVEELAGQIHEARTLRQQAAEEAEALVGAHATGIFREAAKRGTVSLETVVTLERGKFSNRPRNEPRFFGGKHPWIQIGEIESSNKFIHSWRETLNDDGFAISKKFPRGTVLISIAATIGAVGILGFDCCVPDSIVGVTPREDMDSEFLYYYLGYLRSHLEEIAPQSAQKNINLHILSSLPVPQLTLPEQRRIVAELDAFHAEVDALKRLQAATAAELDALLPAILDRAFKGEL